MYKNSLLPSINSSQSIYNILVILSLVAFPIFEVYSLFGVNLSNLIVGSLIMLGLVTGKFKFSRRCIPYYLGIYFIYFIGVTIFSGIYNISEMPNRLAGVLFIMLQFIMFFSCFEKNTFYNIYKVIAIGTIAFFFVQEVGYKATGVRIPGIIPFLPLDSTYASIDAYGTFADYLAIVGRSTSFFSEPARFAQFLLPFLAMILFDGKGWMKWMLTISTVIALFLLQSGNGIIGLFCILSVYFFRLLKKGTALAKLAFFIMIPIIVICGAKYMGNNESSQYYGERMSEITSSSSSGDINSGFYRIYRGYYVYAEYNIIEKLFGINNFHQIETKIKQSSVAAYFPKGDMYFNVIQAFLIKTGLIGVILYILMLFEVWKRTSACGKSILLTFIVFSFMSALHMSAIMIVYFLIPYFYPREKIYI